MRTISLAMASFAGFFLFAVAAIFLVNLLPNAPIQSNLIRTSTAENYQPHPFMFGVMLDQWTECELMTAGLYRDIDPADEAGAFDYREGYASTSKADPITRAWRSTVLSPNIGNCEMLHDGGGGKFYFRYWMGGQVLTRPLLYLSGVNANRILVAAMFLAALAAFLVWIARRAGVPFALGTALLIAAAPLYSQFFLLPHASGWIIGFGFGAMIMKWGHLTRHAAVLAGLWSGMILAFFDILNNPVVVPMAMTFGYFVTCHARAQAPSFLTLALLNGAWFGGYAGFWVSKWVLAAAELGPDAVIANVSGKIGERANMNAGTGVTWRDSLYLNGLQMIMSFVAFAGLSIAAFVGRRRSSRGASSGSGAGKQLVVLAVLASAVPVAWIVVLTNHSAIHYFFVSPVLVWTLLLWHFALLAQGTASVAPQNREAAA
jgi:hypothetical protein